MMKCRTALHRRAYRVLEKAQRGCRDLCFGVVVDGEVVRGAVRESADTDRALSAHSADQVGRWGSLWVVPVPGLQV